MSATDLSQAPADAALSAPVPLLPVAPIEVQQFLLFEADLLDRRALDQWLTLYTPDCIYWMPAESPEGDPERQVSLFFDDRSILEDRVWRLGHPKMFSQNPPVRQVRVLSPPRLDVGGSAGGRIVTRTKFILFEHRLREQRTFGGEYEHTLVPDEGQGYRIARKVVRLVNCDAVLWNIGVPI
jgi:benzoate/toluate 1,2-dioxygenase beta subunit